MSKKPKIEFSDAAFFANASLSGALQKEAKRLLKIAYHNPESSELDGIAYTLPDPDDDDLFALMLTDDLRIIVRWDGDYLQVLDILSMELAYHLYPKQAS